MHESKLTDSHHQSSSQIQTCPDDHNCVATEIMRDDKNCFPLLQLPPELRNRIYHYVFDTAHIMMKPTKYMQGALVYERLHTSALPVVCRQLRRETLALRNKYSHIDMTEALNLARVANMIGKSKCGMIRVITISPLCVRFSPRVHQANSRFGALQTVTVRGVLDAKMQKEDATKKLQKIVGKPDLDVQFIP